MAAITVALHEKIIDLSNKIISFPIGPFLPHIRRRKNPTTVGGRINGSVRIPSITPLSFPL